MHHCCLVLSLQVDISEALDSLDSFKSFNEVSCWLWPLMPRMLFRKVVSRGACSLGTTLLHSALIAAADPQSNTHQLLQMTAQYVQRAETPCLLCVQFFYRKLKPEARPIAQPKDDDVVVSAADCRLSAFATVDDATRCWIKVLCNLLSDVVPGRPGCWATEPPTHKLLWGLCCGVCIRERGGFRQQ